MIGALASRHIREETETKSVKGVRWQSFRTINLALPGPAGVDITGICLLAFENLTMRSWNQTESENKCKNEHISDFSQFIAEVVHVDSN